MKSSEEQRETTERFIADAKEDALRDFQLALYKIAGLPVYAAWRAPQIAQEALGIGMYYSKGMGKPPINRPWLDDSPKSLLGYYWQWLWQGSFRNR